MPVKEMRIFIPALDERGRADPHVIADYLRAYTPRPSNKKVAFAVNWLIRHRKVSLPLFNPKVWTKDWDGVGDITTALTFRLVKKDGRLKSQRMPAGMTLHLIKLHEVGYYCDRPIDMSKAITTFDPDVFIQVDDRDKCDICAFNLKSMDADAKAAMERDLKKMRDNISSAVIAEWTARDLDKE